MFRTIAILLVFAAALVFLFPMLLAAAKRVAAYYRSLLDKVEVKKTDDSK